jgi:oxygen-independent coproporphyrinogen-3 oxidase
MRTVERVLAMDPDRLAIYNYAHLPHMFMPQRRINEAELPSAEVKLDILQAVVTRLTDAGYVFIGMDHFAKPDDDLSVALKQGRLQRNFQGYSTHADHDLLGIGVSAIGKLGPTYSQNVRTLDEYYGALDANLLPTLRGMVLTEDDILRRNIIQRLMCQFALSKEAVEEVHAIDFAGYFAPELEQLAEYERHGMLTIDQEWITVTPKGRFLIRTIAMVFDRHLREKQAQARYSRVI